MDVGRGGSARRVERWQGGAEPEGDRAGSAHLVALTPLIGREDELREVGRLLKAERLVTLTGAPGSGKTRLALSKAERSAAEGRRAFVAELARLESRQLVAQAVLEASGGRGQAGQAALATAADRLAESQGLLVLDNCEHLLAGAAEVAEALLRRCPGLHVLATSREPLGVAGEIVWPTPPLSLPDPEADDPAAALAGSEAGRLFLDRARRARPSFELRADVASAVVRICRELDGLPLAIELAAALAGSLTPAQIADGLADRFRLLTGGPRTAIARHRTLRASLDWSHALLDDAERAALRRAGVLIGGSTLDAIEAVCAVEPAERPAVRALVCALVDKSLLTMREIAGEARYAMLDSIRHYALERLVDAGEESAARDRHLAHFRAVAVDADRILTEPAGRERLDGHGPNLRAALDRALGRDATAALDIAAGLARYWLIRDRFAEGRAVCQRVLEATGADDPRRRAAVLWGAALLATHDMDYVQAYAHGAEGLALAEASGDPRAIGRCLQMMSVVLGPVNPAEGAAMGARAVALLREAGDELGVAHALVALATTEGLRDRFDVVRKACAEFDEIPAAQSDQWLVTWAEIARSWAELLQGDPTRALAHCGRALELEGDHPTMTWFNALAHRLHALARTGQGRRAVEEGLDALESARRSGIGIAVATLEISLAIAELAVGDVEAARARAERMLNADEPHTAVVFHDVLVRAALAAGDPVRARTHAAAIRAIAQHTGSARQMALADFADGEAAALSGEWDEARGHLHAALAGQASSGFEREAADTLEALGALAAELQDAPSAARLLAAAAAIRRRLNCVRVPPGDARIDALAASAREAIGSEDWATAWRQGQAMTFDEAIAYARRSRGRRGRPRWGWESLSPVEAQVAKLAAAGLSNPDIGSRLFVSRGTVKAHLSHVYAKLGVSNRTELAAALGARAADRAGAEQQSVS